jgi:DNA adenine methylase
MSSTEGLRGPLRYIGGKHLIAPWHVSKFPKHDCYISVFGGGASDIFAKEPGNEILNDAYVEVYNFWRVLKELEYRQSFLEKLQLTPLSRKLVEDLSKQAPSQDPVERAYRFFVLNRQTFSGIGTGRPKNSAWSISTRTRKGINESVSAWLSSVELLPDIAERLKLVALENDDFQEVIERHDGPNAFFYCDPPYDVGEEKTNKYYGVPFAVVDQKRLANLLYKIKGKFMVCGYPTDLYKRLYGKYESETLDVKKCAPATEEKSVGEETIWCNYPLKKKESEDPDLFSLLGATD